MDADRRKFLKRIGMAAGSVVAMSALEPFKAFADDSPAASAQPGDDNRMTYRTDKRTGNLISLLGMGMMRLPDDQDVANELVDYAIAHGINYFDTAPMYLRGRSEAITGAALSRHPREKYYVATKMSNQEPSKWSFDESKRIYEKSFEYLQVDYIDYYLLHHIGQDGMDMLRGRFLDNGLLDFLMAEREAGRIRHLGFSYHGNVAPFDWLVDHNDDYHWDFAQIQMNFLDWRHASLTATNWKRDADAEYLYNKLTKAGIPVVVMEPLRGGALNRMPEECVEQLQAVRPGSTPVEWAFRWVGSFPNILTTLSGMNKMEHMIENVRTHSPLELCTAADNEMLEHIADVMTGQPTIPCTACAYCMPCPYGVDIPGNFNFYNEAVASHMLPLPNKSDADYAAKQDRLIAEYRQAVGAERRANQCVDCEACMAKCPQQIRIPNQMGRIVEMTRKR